ncbi:MAG: hypothetical protein COW67_13165 [Flavobacteriales bacterium CG18_big_fil_WC_8_21_14_2_50_32_9]|nr:MAG: hypothetical protein COW67_13165 [Flavobacteriales bacterium CG18_big_fil_WC_8_21_14_2_50_32_9]
MAIGDYSDDVKTLQAYFLRTGLMQPIPQDEFGYYGNKTAKAVLTFQIKYVQLSWYERYIMRGVRVGPKTLAKLNETYS